ncbi:MAG: flagellin [Anaerolineales bacterium]|nr:flagellin [Anaerolineales bacterium]
MAQADFTRIASNIGALNSLNSLQSVNNKLAVHQQRLATGKRINSAGDDPAGLTIANKLQARSEGLKTALNNIADSKNLLSVADAGLSKMNGILVNMRNLSQSAMNDTMGTAERQAVLDQLSSYATQIDDVVKETKWNNVQLLSSGSNFTFQTGADSTDTTTFTALTGLNSAAGGLDVSISGTTTLTSASTSANFGTYMGQVDKAINTVSSKYANVGSLINRLSFKEEQLAVSQVNVEASYNRIMNADMAMEQLEATKFGILQQTGITMLAQANQAPQGVLSLFR